MNCSRVFINARFSFQFSFLHLLLFSCVFIFISFLVCLESERELGRDRSPKDPGRSSSLDEVEGMFSVCCFEISRDPDRRKSKPDDLNDSLSFSTKEQLKALTILPYAK